MTATTPALDRDLLAMLDAIDSGEMPPGALADWLTEQGDEARAEYIRVGVELAGMSESEKYVYVADGSVSTTAMTQCSTVRFATRFDRRAALLAANQSVWCGLPCPGCGGSGVVGKDIGRHLRDVDAACPVCNRSGDLFKRMAAGTESEHTLYEDSPVSRIDPARDFYAAGLVPFVWSVGVRLAEVLRDDLTAEDVPNGPEWEWLGDGTAHRLIPTPFALAVARHCPTVRGFRVTDREPREYDGAIWWSRMRGNQTSGNWCLPESVYSRLEGYTAMIPDDGYAFHDTNREYPTRELAHHALAVALHRLVREAK